VERRDPILKERLFGLTNSEGNHGEDVKEYYFYLDSTPTHSYMKYLYKYPQASSPTRGWSTRTAPRAADEPEYELLDTGVFDDDRYFDVFVEYAKAGPEDISSASRRSTAAPSRPLHVLPHLWFRNTWSWGPRARRRRAVITGGPRADFRDAPTIGRRCRCRTCRSRTSSAAHLYGPRGGELLFTDNETNNAERLFGRRRAVSPYVKDAFHRLRRQRRARASTRRHGTKARCTSPRPCRRRLGRLRCG
jgi:hypothetical protein